jgi:hypothetical protein
VLARVKQLLSDFVVRPRDSLAIGSLQAESLLSMLQTARTAMIRYHSTQHTSLPDAPSTFGGIIWRALMSSDSEVRR